MNQLEVSAPRSVCQQATPEEEVLSYGDEGTASAEAHLREMKELTDKLAAVGAPITEEDQVVTLLGSLPKKYVHACDSFGSSGRK